MSQLSSYIQATAVITRRVDEPATAPRYDLVIVDPPSMAGQTYLEATPVRRAGVDVHGADVDEKAEIWINTHTKTTKIYIHEEPIFDDCVAPPPGRLQQGQGRGFFSRLLGALK
jgi:hypothetical protein